MNFDYVKARPTEMLLRQMQANRSAARYRNPENGKRHHAHIPRYRPFFVGEMLAMRAELRKRNAPPQAEMVQRFRDGIQACINAEFPEGSGDAPQS